MVTVLQNYLSIKFSSLEHQDLLAKHGLGSEADIWEYQGEWFEPPNEKRGGWSGVNYLSLTKPQGIAKGYYLKRQSNYQRRTWLAPLTGEPTYAREFEVLQYLEDKPVKTPSLVYYAQSDTQSILMTAELQGFVSADQWFVKHADQDKQPALRAIANAISALHQTGIEHRALYLKHIFINVEHGQVNVAFIDFEKSRRTRLIRWRSLFDLKRLLKRSPQLTASDSAYLVQNYFKTIKTSWWQRMLSRCLLVS